MTNSDEPTAVADLKLLGEKLGFEMPSDDAVGRLLRVLCRSKPGGRFLELGTGIGLSLAWMIDGMNEDARMISLDNDATLIETVGGIIKDSRVELIKADGDEWLLTYSGPKFDLIFADTWPGKYRLLKETITLLAPGGLYLVDDMSPQTNWPEGHADKAANLKKTLLNYPGIVAVDVPSCN